MVDYAMARIGKDLSKEIEEIKDKRLINGKDKERISTREITNLITKHKHWKIIKEEMIYLEREIFESL